MILGSPQDVVLRHDHLAAFELDWRGDGYWISGFVPDAHGAGGLDGVPIYSRTRKEQCPQQMTSPLRNTNTLTDNDRAGIRVPALLTLTFRTWRNASLMRCVELENSSIIVPGQ